MNIKSPENKDQEAFFTDEARLATKSWLQNLEIKRIPQIFVSCSRIGQSSIEMRDEKVEEAISRERIKSFQKAETDCIKYFFNKETKKLELVVIPLNKLIWLKKQMASYKNSRISLKTHEKRKAISELLQAEFSQVYFPKEIIKLFRLNKQEQQKLLFGEKDLEQILKNRN
ncbi:MAG: hypothetical protein GBAus27B_000604 [Mycoplasmataceae bacterium]|nr:MAG: hypothetical protein GBAus27B_000604 [Mycoplasmataceae bacterium]